MFEWLKAILGEAYTEDIDKKVAEEIGKSFVARADFNTANTEKKALADTVAKRDKQLESLKTTTGDVDALKAEITKLQEINVLATQNHEAEITKLKIETAVELALTAAKAKNVKSAKALLDLEGATLAKDGSVKGLDDQIKKLIAAPDSSFLFEAADPQQQQFQGMKPPEKQDTGAPSGMTLDAFKKLSPAERHDFASSSPEAYQNLYGGTS